MTGKPVTKGVRLESLKVDVDLENEGTWVKISEWPGVAFEVRSTNYAPFVAARTALELKWAEEYKDADVPVEVATEGNAVLAVEHLLKNWRGFIGDDDQPVPVSQAREVLSNPAFRKIRARVFIAAQTVGQRSVEVVTEAAKN